MNASRREKNAAATREVILTAARRRFAAESYDAVGMRDVAAEAGINVALVSRYFGSKEELFRKVLLERGDEAWFDEPATTREVAEWLASLVFADAQTGRHDDLERLLIILRSASSPATARIVSTAFVADVFHPLVGLLGGEHGSVRAGLALSLVIGATVLNGILSVEPIPVEQRDEGRRRLIEMIEQALSEEP